MLDSIVGLVLLGLGLNTSSYNTPGMVKGDTTVATQEARLKPPPIKNVFRLTRENFESAATNAGKRRLDTRAFGKGVLHMQADFRAQFEASREAAKQEFENEKTAFKQKLATIRDTKKQTVVDRLNTNCQEINQKRTDKMTTMVGKLSDILTNVSNRTASAAASGKDTTSVETAITVAQTDIANAQTAIASQAGITCTMTITTEANLKTDVGKVVNGLQSQLQSVYQKVLVARKSVGDAIRALTIVTGEKI